MTVTRKRCRRGGGDGDEDSRVPSFLFLLLVFLGVSGSASGQQQEEFCIIEGFKFEDGANMGALYQTSCGSTEDFPCFCDADIGGQVPISCPYCAFSTQEGDISCLRDGEASTIIDTDGVDQECSCTVVGGFAHSVCVASSPDGGESEGVCVLDAVFTTFEFQNGEAFPPALVESPCSDQVQYPCYCNTGPGPNVYCPYCQYTNTRLGQTECGSIGETTVFQDRDLVEQSCTCIDGTTSTCDPTPSPTNAPTNAPTIAPTNAPTRQPTPSPTNASTRQPTRFPTLAPVSPPPTPAIVLPTTSAPTPAPTTPAPTLLPTPLPTSPPTPEPTQQPTLPPTAAPTPVPTTEVPSASPTRAELPTFVKPTIPRRPSPAPTLPPGCVYRDPETGKREVVSDREAFATTTGVIGPCQPEEDWLAVCNTRIPSQREYPYCVFSAFVGNSSSPAVSAERSSSWAPVCARPDQSIAVPQRDGNDKDCTCLYFNSLIGAVSNCPLLDVDLSDPPTPQPSFSPTSASPTESPTGAPSPSDESSSSTSVFLLSSLALSVAATMALNC